MGELNSILFDQFTDNQFTGLAVLAREYRSELNFAKTANLDSAEVEKLKDRAFAWPERRMFPIHTPEHTMLSYLYTKLSEEIPSEVIEHIKIAADIYGITLPQATITKIASDSLYYLLPRQAMYPVSSAEDCVKFAECLPHVIPQLPITDRTVLCERFLKVAEIYSANVPDVVKQLAGEVVTSTRLLKEALEVRANTASKTTKFEYEKLANLMDKLPDEVKDYKGQRLLVNKIASLDIQEGLDRFWGKKISDPVLSVFNTTKMGEHPMLDMVLGRSPQELADVLGEDILPEITDSSGELDPEKVATVIPTLPLSLKRELIRALRL